MITHPEKVLFPDDDITKGDVAAYYQSIAKFMIPLVRMRPVMLERYHRGIGVPGFFQKNVVKGFPSWLERISVPKKDGTLAAPLVTDERSLLWMVNQNSIALHVWASRAPNLHCPDLCVFDLDPMQDEPDVLRKVALALRDMLLDLRLESWVKTSGSKGFHIVVPLDGATHFAEVETFASAVARRMIADDPEHLTLEFAKADRGGRIYLDIGRNGFGATFAAPYSVRPIRGAPVSAPCTWDEVERGAATPRSFHLRDMRERAETIGDPWAALKAQSLGAAMERVRRE